MANLANATQQLPNATRRQLWCMARVLFKETFRTVLLIFRNPAGADFPSGP